MVKIDFIQNCYTRGKETFGSDSNPAWTSGAVWRGDLRSGGGFWPNPSSRVLAEGRPVWSGLTWGVEDREPDQTSRVGVRAGLAGFLPKLERVQEPD